ncbi:MAG: hypothetical protein WCA51_09120 [Dehalococcoidia bacterium]
MTRGWLDGTSGSLSTGAFGFFPQNVLLVQGQAAEVDTALTAETEIPQNIPDNRAEQRGILAYVVL